ncbi:endonuclease/exonuclease/phosphatase family protein [Halovulum sp. GXIMD14793]
MLARLLATIFLFCAAGVAIGFLPDLHRATDTISLLRPGFGLMCLIGLGFSRSILMRLALGIAVLSRHPFSGPPKCSDWRAVAAAPIMIGGQEVWIVSLHIHWPWPFQSAEAEAAAAGVLTPLQGPTVIAGDFNMLPWTQRVQRIARMTGTRLAGPAQFTFSRRNIPLPIDLVLAPGGGQVRMRPLIGSDHAGVVADISLKND